MTFKGKIKINNLLTFISTNGIEGFQNNDWHKKSDRVSNKTKTVPYNDEIVRFMCNKCDFKSYHKRSIAKHQNRKSKKDKLHSEGNLYIMKLGCNISEKPICENNTKEYKCYKCSYSSNSTEQLKFHMKSAHFDQKRYACNYCHYKSFFKINMKRHVPKHKLNQDEQKFRKIMCKNCDEKVEHNEHVYQDFSVTLKELSCCECNYSSNCDRKLKMHIESTHRNLKCYQCCACEFKAYYYGNMKKHHLRNHAEFQMKKIKLVCKLCEDFVDHEYHVYEEMDVAKKKKPHCNLNNKKKEKKQFSCKLC